MTDNNIYRVTPRKAAVMLEEIISAGLVPFLQSSPGIGKSSIHHALAKAFNLKLIDHRMSTSVPEDMNGLLRFDENGHARFAPIADLFPLAGQALPVDLDKDGNVIHEYEGWLLFLDEWNSAGPGMEAAAYKLILDRAVGQFKLHDRVVISAAGNLITDRAIVNRMGTAMQSRVIHLEMEANFDEWLMDIGLKHQYDPRIIGYLSQNESHLMHFNPAHKDKTFPCPRTWEFLNKLVKGKEVRDDFVPMYAGTIGAEVAVQFVQFSRVYQKVSNWTDIIASPLSHPIPDDLTLRWVTIMHLLEHCDEDNLDKMVQYIHRLELQFQILFLRSLLLRKPNIHAHPTYRSEAARLAKYLI